MNKSLEINASRAFAAVAAYNHSCDWCVGGSFCDGMWEELDELDTLSDFKVLGAGGSRIALYKDDFVFKVEYRGALDHGFDNTYFPETSNVRELNNWIKWMDEDFGEFRLPATDVVWIADQPVLVTEFIDPDGTDWSYEYSPGHQDFIKRTKLNDIYCDNVIKSGDYWYVVDFAQ